MKKRKEWVNKIFRKRCRFGEFNHLYKDLSEDDSHYFSYFRMSKKQFLHLLSIVAPSIHKASTNYRESVSEKERLALTLRFLATGNSFRSLSYSFRLGLSTVSSIIHETCAAIWTHLQPLHLASPQKESWIKIAQEFANKWNFPSCIGAIDGKHVRVRCPSNQGSNYYNYKGYHSIILLAVVDANYRFVIVDIGGKGRESDGGVFGRSEFYHALQSNQLNLPGDCPLPGETSSNPHVFVADDAFPLKKFIMKPYSSRHLDEKKRIFNYRLSCG